MTIIILFILLLMIYHEYVLHEYYKSEMKKVYIVEASKTGKSKVYIGNINNNLFIKIASEQHHIYSLREYEDLVYYNELDHNDICIRFL